MSQFLSYRWHLTWNDMVWESAPVHLGDPVRTHYNSNLSRNQVKERLDFWYRLEVNQFLPYSRSVIKLRQASILHKFSEGRRCKGNLPDLISEDCLLWYILCHSCLSLFHPKTAQSPYQIRTFETVQLDCTCTALCKFCLWEFLGKYNDLWDLLPHSSCVNNNLAKEKETFIVR